MTLTRKDGWARWGLMIDKYEWMYRALVRRLVEIADDAVPGERSRPRLPLGEEQRRGTKDETAGNNQATHC